MPISLFSITAYPVRASHCGGAGAEMGGPGSPSETQTPYTLSWSPAALCRRITKPHWKQAEIFGDFKI